MPGLFRKTPTATPSFNHPTVNKCSNPKCTCPNPYQRMDGLYPCVGTVRNRPCTGTYAVSLTQPPLTNSCNNPRCHYPNPGQCAEGTFICQGIVRNKPCKGTYDVSRSQVALVDEQASKYFMEEDKRRHRENPEFFRAQEQYMREREQEKQILKLSKKTNHTGLTPEARRGKHRHLPQGLERKGAQRGRTALDEYVQLPPTYPPPLPTHIQETSHKDRFLMDEYSRPPPPFPPPPPLPTQIRERSHKPLPPLPPQIQEKYCQNTPPPLPARCALPNPPRAFARTAYYNPTAVVAIMCYKY